MAGLHAAVLGECGEGEAMQCKCAAATIAVVMLVGVQQAVRACSSSTAAAAAVQMLPLRHVPPMPQTPPMTPSVAAACPRCALMRAPQAAGVSQTRDPTQARAADAANTTDAFCGRLAAALGVCTSAPVPAHLRARRFKTRDPTQECALQTPRTPRATFHHPPGL
jgi:hypothetical protein